MKKKFVSLLLSLSVFCTVMMPGISAYAVNGENDGDSGMVINKTATANEDGTYTVRLEAYATGEKFITEVTEDVPTDIVLVLDQSGSMKEKIGAVSFEPYQDVDGQKRTINSFYHSRRHNGGEENLYYPIGEGVYASVSVTRQREPIYNKIPSGQNNNYYWNNRNNLHARVNGGYVKVEVERGMNWSDGRLVYTYTYSLPNGDVISTSTGYTASPTFSGTDDNVLYLLSIDETQNVYTYTYTDANGETQTIGVSTGADTQFGIILYEKTVDSNTGEYRIVALKNALTRFTSAVNTKAAGEDGQPGTADDVNHRIAVVGYASQNNNTEVFIGASQHSYGTEARRVYGSAFQNMNSTAGQANVEESINALEAEGGTYTNLGIEMANGILNANPVGTGETRNRVVIVFTDGKPGRRGYDSNVANAAITQAGIAKAAGATVYAVGIFAGADATSPGNASGTDIQKANWFMQNLSSNNGTVQSPSYYLSAADEESLNNIFQQISDNIEIGGSHTTLSEETVIRDIIAPEFELARGADMSQITLETYSYTGEDQWEPNHDPMGASVSVEGDTVSVTGFDFSENYVGTVRQNGMITYRGDKLEIIFKVSLKAGFLGGNNVYTNTSAGVYENSEAQNPVLIFERPQVNVPVGEVNVTAEDKNVYLLNGLTAEALRSGATATVGGISLNLDPNAENYGLADWQTSGVVISVVITDAEGNVISEDLTGLREDTTYNIAVTVSPKEDVLPDSSGTAAETKSGDEGANIYVFKPELTYQDSDVYYGADVPDEFTENLTDIKWKHGETEADSVVMMGTAPQLNLSYKVDEKMVENGKINTKQDVSVDAVVMIGDTDVTGETGFLHTDCDPACGWVTPEQGGTPAFLLHVRTCRLTIIKTGGDEHEPYVFDVLKDGEEYSEITIVGNGSETIYELPVGDYTIREDEGWSWRYSAVNGENAILTAQNTEGSITCSNYKTENDWLNGFSEVVKNIFGVTP